MTFLIVAAHVAASVVIAYCIKTRKDRTEEYVHFALVLLVAIAGLVNYLNGQGGSH